MVTTIPAHLCDPAFRFVPLRPKGQPVGKDNRGKPVHSTGKELAPT